MVLVILLVVIIALAIYGVVTYNQLVTSKTSVDESWSQIDVQLKRRNDLIPNLISTVKGAANYEQATLTKVTQLRQQVMQLSNDDGASKQDLMKVSSQLADSLKTVFAVSENYPDLKANSNFQQLSEELTNTENKIAYARQLYNSSVGNYNNQIATFPNSVIANMKHFEKVEYLQTEASEKATPKVDFDFGNDSNQNAQ